MDVWLNGQFMPAEEARVSPFDRGFLFGDGVYEGIRYFNGVAPGMADHVERLRRSLAGAGIERFDPRSLPSLCDRLVEHADAPDSIVYLQITRGVEIPRQHVPHGPLEPTVFGYALAAPSLEEIASPNRIACITMEDPRWRRCEIKAVSLLANVLSLIEAAGAGAAEVIFHRDGLVGEGAMTNVFAVLGDSIITPPVDGSPPILHGVTRAGLLLAAEEASLDVREQTLPLADLCRADEVFVSSSRRIISAVATLDGRPVGGGRRREPSGEKTLELFRAMRRRIASICGLDPVCAS
jgi:D-alanine transaminase